MKPSKIPHSDKKSPSGTKKSSPGLSAAPVIRIARQSGADRISSDGIQAIITKTEEYIGDLARNAAQSASDHGRKTMRAVDVEKIR